MEGVVLEGKYFCVVWRGSPATGAFIMRHEYFPNKRFYATKMMIHIIEEGPEEDFLYLEENFLELLHSFSSVPTIGGGKQIQRQGRRIYSPIHPPFRQLQDNCGGV